MSCPRVAASASGAALVFLLLQLMSSAGVPRLAAAQALSPETRAALSAAAGNSALLPWQRHAMRSLADPRTAPPQPAVVTGTDGAWNRLPAPLSLEAAAVFDPVRRSMLYFGGKVRLGGATPLAPGMYLVRLTRADRVLTAKAVTIP